MHLGRYRCQPFLECFFKALAGPIGEGSKDAFEYDVCLENVVGDGGSPFACAVSYLPPQIYNEAQQTGCNGQGWELSRENWIDETVDDAIRFFVDGGNDGETTDSAFFQGAWWPGLSPGQSLTKELGKQLVGDANFDRTLDNVCSAVLNCDQIGSRTGLILFRGVLKSFWGLMVIAALIHMNR